MRKSRIPLVLAILASLGIAAPAAARDFAVAVQGRLLSMELAGHLVSVPGPLWTGPDEAVTVEQSQIVYKQVAPGVESVLFLPVSETLVTWTRMMGVVAVQRPGYRAENQVAAVVQPLTGACTAGQVLVSPTKAVTPGGREGLLVMCGRYRPTGTGPRNCAGTIMVAVVLESAKGAMSAYQEWCTGAFEVHDTANWPVPEIEVRQRAADLQQATSFVPVAE